MIARTLLLAALFSSCCTMQARAEIALPRPLQDVGFDQKLGDQVPLDLPFTNEHGETVCLRDYSTGRPVILVLAYYRCPMLCTLVINGLVRGLVDVPFDAGRDFQVVVVSIDSRETPELAREKKKTYVERYGRLHATEGWHFLVGSRSSIDALAHAVGFRFAYDASRDEFAHASGLVILTPDGWISKYFYDVKFAPRDLRLGLVEASERKIGSPVDQILLFCFHYDPQQGKYGPAIMNFVRAGGVVTLLSLAGLVVFLWRRSPHADGPLASPSVGPTVRVAREEPS